VKTESCQEILKLFRFANTLPHPCRLSEVIYQYIGGLRAGMGYVGAATINDL
jgi:hypothetical protein